MLLLFFILALCSGLGLGFRHIYCMAFATCVFQCGIKQNVWIHPSRNPPNPQVCDELFILGSLNLPSKKKNLSSVFNRFASRPEGIRLQIRPSSTEPYCISLLSHFLLLPTVLEQSRATLSVNFWKEKKHYEILLLLFGHHPHVVFEMSHYFTPPLQTALPPFIWLQDHVKYFGARF